MKQRCFNKKSQPYQYYGARGITVCAKWLNYNSFHNWAIQNGYKKGLTIERINNDGNYYPSNCQWVTQKEQNHNKSTSRKITFNSETLCLSEWAERLDISPSGLSKRLKRWPISEALTQPVKKQFVR